MTNLPTSSFDGSGSGSTSTGPQPYISSLPPSSPRRRIGVVVAIVVALLVIGGTAAVVISDDSDGSSTDETSATVESAAVPAPTTTGPTESAGATLAPVVTEAGPAVTDTSTASTPSSSGSSSPSTDNAATTTTFAVDPTATLPPVPAGAIDLGYGVYIPIPSGWTEASEPGSIITLSNGSTSVAVQALVRAAGENPAQLVQDYVDTFDSDFESVSYGPTANIRRFEGQPAIDVYSTFFFTNDLATRTSLAGFVDVSIRSDGLSLIYNVYGPSETSGGFPSAAADELRISFQHAPQVAATVELVPVPPFRVRSAHTFVPVDGLVGFTAAPGFRVVNAGNGRGFVTNESEDFQVDKVVGQADTNAVTASAQAVIAQNYTGVAYSELVLDSPDPYGIVHGAFSWTGTYLQGNLSAGSVDFYFDPASGNAFVVFRTWFTATDQGEPYPDESQFMLRSLFNAVTTIP